MLERPHRRLNPLTNEWVLVSPQRATRPWQGQLEPPATCPSVEYDPQCYLCPGNARSGGHRNPAYTSTFVFDNDFPALLADGPTDFSPDESADNNQVLVAEPERGICRVVCFSPRHDVSISDMESNAVAKVVDAWCDQARELEAVPWVRYVQIFENRGVLMGASNPHPHCQVWASEHIPNEIVRELAGQRQHYQRHGVCVLCSCLKPESESERVVCANQSFVAVVPFWAVWPFETLVMATRHFQSFESMSIDERRDLAAILQAVTRRYDTLFASAFPYSMGFHPAPARSDEPAWHFHAHFYPPLLRSAAIRKFMVGYEMLANAQRDVTPEWAAEQLRLAGVRSGAGSN